MPVVHVSLIKGRTKEQKALMANEISETIHKHSGAPRRLSSSLLTMWIQIHGLRGEPCFPINNQ